MTQQSVFVSHSSDVPRLRFDKPLELYWRRDGDTVLHRSSRRKSLSWCFDEGGGRENARVMCQSKISHKCSTVLRSGEFEGHTIQFTSSSYSSNHSVDVGRVILGNTTPIRRETFHHRTKVISQKNVVLLCSDCSC